jgi:hypothetical protein
MSQETTIFLWKSLWRISRLVARRGQEADEEGGPAVHGDATPFEAAPEAPDTANCGTPEAVP